MIRVITFDIIFLALFVGCFGLEKTQVIQTHKGPVQGKILRSLWKNTPYSAFLGIPYAEPPIEDLRFKPPVERKSWSEVLPAFTEGSVCPQYDFIFNNLTGNEDCLYLNVYTPEILFGKNMRNNLKPVMVYVYGGAFSSGYSNYSLYGPDFVIEDDVLLVTFNYRLGALGFLSLQHVNASGNAGLKDQHLVLEWVQKNIANFGGDPKKVTLVGQSAGGVSVDYHVLSEKSQGLFQRSISMSGSALALWAFITPAMAKGRAQALGENLGCDVNDNEKLLSCLTKAPMETVVEASRHVSLIPTVAFVPVMETNVNVPQEKKIITECSFNKYLRGDFLKQPHLMGFMKDEAVYFAKPIVDLILPLDMIISMLNYFKDTPIFNLFTEPTVDVAAIIRSLITSVILNIINILSDVVFLAPIDLKQKMLSQKNPFPIYYYQISHESEYDYHRVFFDINVSGAAHGDDFGYIFPTRLTTQIPTDPSVPYNQFRRRFTTLWTNFVKYGNPTPDGQGIQTITSHWPDSRDSGQQYDINVNFTVKERQINTLTRFLENVLYRTLPYYSDC